MTGNMLYIGMPAYNEGKNLPFLLQEICWLAEESLPYRDITVVVVDDGSADDTAKVVRNFAALLDRKRYPRLAIDLVPHEVNKGLAEAMKTLLTHVAGRGKPRDVLVTMDGDNSHPPGLIVRMLELVGEGHDVVIASRYQRGGRVLGLSWFRRFLSVGAAWMFRLLFPITNVRDYTCGYRAYQVPVLQRALKDNPNFVSERGFSCMVDILLKLRTVRPPLVMSEVPMVLRYDKKAGASKMRVLRTVKDTLKLLARRRLGDMS
jgi:dolichol-phosphate mannosyltransferase